MISGTALIVPMMIEAGVVGNLLEGQPHGLPDFFALTRRVTMWGTLRNRASDSQGLPARRKL